MARLIDTNILLRAIQPSHPMHTAALSALERLFIETEPLYIAIQNVAEFWNAATRPVAHNGLGMTIEQAAEEIKRLEGFFQIIGESRASYAEWKTLLTVYGVRGAQVHDARLAAVMRANAITKIVTFNAADFKRFEGIEAIHPAEIA